MTLWPAIAFAVITHLGSPLGPSRSATTLGAAIARNAHQEEEEENSLPGYVSDDVPGDGELAINEALRVVTEVMEARGISVIQGSE